MHLVKLIALGLSAATLAATSADAQSLGKHRGNEDQQQNGYSKPTHQEPKKFPLDLSWIAVSLNGKPFTGTERPDFKLDSEFRVRGFGGCNSYATTAFPLKDQGIAVGPLAMTKKACDSVVMAREQAFLVALRTAAKWDTSIGTLIMKGPSGEIRFERSL